MFRPGYCFRDQRDHAVIDVVGDVLDARALALQHHDAFRLEELGIHERRVLLGDEHLVIHEAHHVLDVAEIERHVEVVAREFLGGNRDLALPGVPVNELALAGISQLAVAGVEPGGDDDLFHC